MQQLWGAVPQSSLLFLVNVTLFMCAMQRRTTMVDTDKMAPVSNLLFFLPCFLKRQLLTFFCTAGWVLLASAQQTNINFTALTTKDGLSSNTVNAILK
ncbi:MAG TPA: hypothetical protein VFT06_02160, partial [Flavisolibacter sp.]|nr:hypothetical protein [Flavisolibacter sp.]